MPLLCISLLALLLLPLSLSCNTTLSNELHDNMQLVLKVRLDNTNDSIEASLQSSTCLAKNHKLPNCINSDADVVNTFYNLTCKMKKLDVPEVKDLVKEVLGSLKCICQIKPTTKPKRKRKVTTKLCKAKAILSAMTVCFEKLNNMLAVRTTS
ncbi:hypothetical protein ABVT39_009144 [Epinephelus coioides]